MSGDLVVKDQKSGFTTEASPSASFTDPLHLYNSIAGTGGVNSSYGPLFRNNVRKARHS